MKQYLLFCSDESEPDLGWEAKRGSFDTIDAAKKRFSEIKEEEENSSFRNEAAWAQIVDTRTGCILQECSVLCSEGEWTEYEEVQNK